MNAYPVLNSNNLNLLQMNQPVQVAAEPAPAAEPVAAVETELEPVQTNQKFLKKLAASKRKVLRQARTLKRFSYGMGGVAVILAVGSLISAMSLKYQAKKAAMEAAQNPEHHMLQASKHKGFDLHSLSWSSMISTMIWSLVAAKAKSGIAAAGKPESGSIKSAAKKGIFCIVLVAIATGMKLAGDNKMLDEFFEENLEGIKLQAVRPTEQTDADMPSWGWGDEDDWWPSEEKDADNWYPDAEDLDDWWPSEEEVEDEIPEEWMPEEEDVDEWVPEEKWEDIEEEWEPRHHGRGHRRGHHEDGEKHHGRRGHKRGHHDDGEEHHRRGHRKRHGRKGHGKKHLKAQKSQSLYEELQAKYANDPASLKKEIKVAGVFTGIFVLAISISYMSLLNSYKKSVKKHEFLLSIYQNPNAKVVPQHKAKEFIAQKTAEVKAKKAAKKQLAAQEEYNKKMAYFQQQQMMLMAQHFPTQAPAPVNSGYVAPKIEEADDMEFGATETKKEEFNYSLCESIDYQAPVTETPAPVVEAPVPEMEKVEAEAPVASAPTTIQLTREQYEALVKVAPQLSALGVQTTQNKMD